MKKKLIICHPKYADVEVLEGEVVTEECEFKGLDISGAFEKIMKEGYGGKIPAVFIGTTKDGEAIKGGKELLANPEIDTIYSIAPMAGG